MHNLLHIVDTSLEKARLLGNASFLEEGLVLTDRICDAPISQEPKRMTFILMALCLRGKAQYTIDTRKQTVTPGDLLFVSEGHIVDNYTASADFDCLCIMVSTQFYHDFVQNVQNVSSLLLFSMNNPVVKLTSHEIQVYTDFYLTIREKIADTSHHYQTELVKALLLAMFYDLSNVIYRIEQQGSQKQSRADGIFAQFIRLLEQNFRTERRVSWYAKQLGITPKYLSEVVKKVSRRTPNDWIDQYVVLEIRVLLKNTTKNIKEITEELHFPNQSFFGKYFKDHVGFSPSAFRKN